MSFISTKSKIFINIDKTVNILNRGYTLTKNSRSIDRVYTTFGGTSCLTKEQYEKGMSLSKKMKKMSSW